MIIFRVINLLKISKPIHLMLLIWELLQLQGICKRRTQLELGKSKCRIWKNQVTHLVYNEQKQLEEESLRKNKLASRCQLPPIAFKQTLQMKPAKEKKILEDWGKSNSRIAEKNE